jgi:hypothetical protein
MNVGAKLVDSSRKEWSDGCVSFQDPDRYLEVTEVTLEVDTHNSCSIADRSFVPRICFRSLLVGGVAPEDSSEDEVWARRRSTRVL